MKTEANKTSRDKRHKEASELSPTKRRTLPGKLESTIKKRGKDNLHNRKHLDHLYTDLKLSTRQIARLAGVHSKNAVTYWLIKHGIPIRDNITASVLAHLKYPRHPFTGDDKEKSYMIGLRAGDLHAQRTTSLSIKARVQTTHPAMQTLMESTFGKYGTVYSRPYFDKRYHRFTWDILVWLDNTFSFVIKKPGRIPKWILRNTDNFLSFLAGYFDAEGIVTLSHSKNRPSISLRIATYDRDILQDAFRALSKMGLHPTIRIQSQKGTNTSYGAQKSACWSLALHRRTEIIHLARHLPLRHSEKTTKLALLVKIFRNRRLSQVRWTDIAHDVEELRHQIDQRVKAFAHQAKQLRLKRRE